MNKTIINLLFAGTSDYLKYAVITAVSAKLKLNKNYNIKMFYLYADIVKAISEEERYKTFEYAKSILDKYEIEYEFIDVKNDISIFKNQNIGIWGEAISMTHYMYLLAPKIMDVPKIIYLDTDMIVNCDLADVYNIDLENKLLAMASPHGGEIYEDMPNSGFIVLNLNQWKSENTLEELLKFGEQIPKSNFCDQNLIYQFFVKNKNDRIYYLSKYYNYFPQVYKETSLDDIKILHYAGANVLKPWNDSLCLMRGSYNWWQIAIKFYFFMWLKSLPKHICLQVFSIKYSFNQKYKIITILGIKIKIKRKNK